MTAVYGLLFNGQFGTGGRLPVWLIATASVMAIAAITILLYWVRGLAARRFTKDQMRDVSGFFWMIVVTGAVGDMLAVGAEITFSAAAVWLMVPIATLTYAMCVVWLYRRRV